jgi:hypothetical protein
MPKKGEEPLARLFEKVNGSAIEATKSKLRVSI